MLSYTAPAVTAAEATAYLSAAGVTGWPTNATAQDQAILRAQRYIAARFNARWVEEWTTVPDAVKHAICEAALIEAREPGKLSPVSTPSGDKVLTGLGSLKWERVKGAGGVDAYIPRIATIEGLLAALVTSATGGVTFLARA